MILLRDGMSGVLTPVSTDKKMGGSIYYIKNQRDATLAVLFINNRKNTQHVSDSSRVHH